jgi:hypothetical protein
LKSHDLRRVDPSLSRQFSSARPLEWFEMPFLREEVLSALFLTLMFLGTPEVLLKRSKKKQSLQAKSEKMIVFLLSLL